MTGVTARWTTCVGIAVSMALLASLFATPASASRVGRWTNLAPPASPRAVTWPAVAYDSRADRVIMFGGCVSVPDFCGAANDTWSYDFNSDTWTRLTPAVSPPIRYRHGMAYDPPSDRVILFGGSGGTGPLGDTWAYDFIANAWTLLSAGGGPPPLSNVAAAYDVRADRVIVFRDGNGSDAWAYDVNMNAWTDLGLTIPLALGALTAAYDDRADRTVVFTGDTLALDSARNSIVNRDPPQIPYPFTSGIAYDASADRVIVLTTDHGSWPQPVLSATWSFDDVRDRWVHRRPVVSPPAVASAALAYDSRHARTIMFGGYPFAPPYRPQTWAYDHRANRWTELAPTISPSLRSDHVMAYDSRSDKVILFGGCCAPALMADTWAYDFTTNRWAEMTPAVSPPAREHSAMAY